jgi:hypothetical protein
VSDVFNDAAGHVPESDEVAKPLKRLQQHKKTQPGRLAFGRLARQLQFGLSGRVEIDQFPTAHAVLSRGYAVS